MDGEDDGIAVLEVPAGPLDPVCKYIGSGHLHGGGEIDDDGILGSGDAPGVDHRLAHLKGVLGLGARIALGRILQSDMAVKILHSLLYHEGTLYCQILYLFLAHVKYHVPLESGSGVVNVEDHIFNALDGFEGPVDKLLSALA